MDLLTQTNVSLAYNATMRFTPTYQGQGIPTAQRIAFTCAYTLIICLSLFGNTMLVAIIYKFPRMRTRTNYLLMNAAISDIAGVVILGRTIYVFAMDDISFDIPGWLGEALCKIFPFLRDTSIMVSVHSMVAITCDRFYAVVFPTMQTPSLLRAKFVVPFIWVTSIAYFSPYFFVYRIRVIYNARFCLSVWDAPFDPLQSPKKFQLTLIVTMFMIPLSVIVVLYTAIAISLRRQKIPGVAQEESIERRRKRNKKVCIMAAVIVLGFFICWVPYHALTLYISYVWKNKPPRHVLSYLPVMYDIFVTMSFMSFVINPYICFMFSENFRKCLRQIFCRNRIGPITISTQATRSLQNRVAEASL